METYLLHGDSRSIRLPDNRLTVAQVDAVGVGGLNALQPVAYENQPALSRQVALLAGRARFQLWLLEQLLFVRHQLVLRDVEAREPLLGRPPNQPRFTFR